MKKLIQFFVAQSIFLSGTVYCSYTPVANTPGTTIWEIGDTIQGIVGGNHVISQANVPVTISTPGTYALSQDLTGSGSFVIHITANNVTLDLKGHTITATGVGTDAIQIDSTSNVAIRNGSIKCTIVGPSGILVSSASSTGFSFENLSITGAVGASGGALFFQNTTNNVEVNNCSIIGFNGGFGTSTNATNITIFNSRFFQCTQASISILGAGNSNICIANVVIDEGGLGITGTQTEFLVLENIFISAVGNTVGQSGINFGLTSSSLLSNVNVMGAGQSGPTAGISGIAFGDSDTVTIEGCNVNGCTGDGIVLNTCDAVTIEGCNISGCAGDGILSGVSTNIVIRNCTVDQCTGTGVNVTGGSPTNHVYNTLSTNNTAAQFAGVPAVLIATSDLAASTAPYWVNLGY